MVTVMATSMGAAVKMFLANYPAAPGDPVSVKKRGEGGWEEYEVAEPKKQRRPRTRGPWEDIELP